MGPLTRLDEEGKGCLDKAAPFDAEQAGSGEIYPGDESLLIEGQKQTLSIKVNKT